MPADTTCDATAVQEAPLVPLPPPQEVPIPALILQSLDKNRPNGDGKISTRKEAKGFRIGSARRVTEQHASLTNGDVEKSKFPACLLTGEGDPDFGTPVWTDPVTNSESDINR